MVIGRLFRTRSSVLALMLLLLGVSFASSLPHTTLPAAAAPLSQSSGFSALGPKVYKIVTGLESVDGGDLSTYYQVNAAGWQSNGYNASLFATCASCNTVTSPKTPYNGAFALNLSAPIPFAAKPSWALGNSSGTTGGKFIAVRNTNTTFTFGTDKGSFHSFANVTGTVFGFSGVYQNFSFVEYAPLVSNVNVTSELYPVTLSDTTNGPDALIVFRFDLSYYNSSTPTRIFFVYQDLPVEPLAPAFPYSNDTNTRVFPLTGLSFNQWNRLSWNLTNYAIQGFGLWRGLDMNVLGVTVQSWSRNQAVSEFYLDNLAMSSSKTRQASHNLQLSIMNNLNSTSFPLFGGVGDMATPQGLQWLDTTSYPTPGSTTASISLIQSNGGYAFLTYPLNLTGLYPGVAGVPLQSSYHAWEGDGNWTLDGTGLWDKYLSHGILAMGYIDQNTFTLSDISAAVSGRAATFVYGSSLSGPMIVEALAQGRSFGAQGWIKPTMSVFLTSFNDSVAMGRFPIYVDPSTSTVTLHIKMTNLPPSNNLSIRIIRNGTIIDTRTIAPLAKTYDQNITEPFPDSSDYYRYELYSTTNPILAFSNPLIFVKSSTLSGVWLAETPGLAYGTAQSFLSAISQTSQTLQFTVNDPANAGTTTTIHYPFSPGSVANATSWSYDPSSKTLTVGTVGSVKVKVSPTSSSSLVSIAQGPSNTVLWNSFAGGSWSAWQQLPGSTLNSALCSLGQGNVDLFVRDGGNSIMENSFIGGAWTGWSTPGGATIDTPSCAVSNNVLYLAVRGADNGTWVNSRQLPSGLWTGWVSWAGATPSAPVLTASSASNRVDMVVRGMDNGIWHRALVNGVLRAWDTPGGATPNAPATVSDGGGIQLAVRGLDNAAWYNRFVYATHSWAGWSSLGGSTPAQPILALDSTGTLHLVVLGNDNAVWHMAKPSGLPWSLSWNSAGGYVLGLPGVAASDGTLVVLVRGGDGNVWTNSLVGSAWQGWTNLHGGPVTDSLAASNGA